MSTVIDRLRSRQTGLFVIVLALGLLAASAVPVLNIGEWTLWTIQAGLACSLVFVWGKANIFSLGQAGLYGLGG
jgi:ABC-type branched-subunit amino acid transport system permease subunit